MSDENTTTPDPTPEEAERQIRTILADADLRDDKLDAFVARVPTMRTSDLFSYLADPAPLTTALGLMRNEDDLARLKLIGIAAVFAIKDEIDRRFPIPKKGDGAP